MKAWIANNRLLAVSFVLIFLLVVAALFMGSVLVGQGMKTVAATPPSSKGSSAAVTQRVSPIAQAPKTVATISASPSPASVPRATASSPASSHWVPIPTMTAAPPQPTPQSQPAQQKAQTPAVPVPSPSATRCESQVGVLASLVSVRREDHYLGYPYAFFYATIRLDNKLNQSVSIRPTYLRVRGIYPEPVGPGSTSDFQFDGLVLGPMESKTFETPRLWIDEARGNPPVNLQSFNFEQPYIAPIPLPGEPSFLCRVTTFGIGPALHYR